jgi:hypothetical protein
MGTGAKETKAISAKNNQKRVNTERIQYLIRGMVKRKKTRNIACFLKKPFVVKRLHGSKYV